MSGGNVNWQGVRGNLNLQVAFSYEEATALAPTDAATKTLSFAWPYTKIWLFSDSELYFTWSLSSSDVIDTSNSLKLPAGVPIEMGVPWGLSIAGTDDTIYFQCRRVASGTADVRVAKG